MMENFKSLAASVMSALSWIGAMQVQDTFIFILSSIATLLTIIFVLLGIRNRRIDHKIKKQQLKELSE